MNAKKIRQIFERFQLDNPDPKPELLYQSPFELLIAVMLSAQTSDAAVNRVTRVLFPVANTPESILVLGEKRLKTYIRQIGLYNAKAKHIIQTCRQLIERHGSQVPEDREALESLSGVGRKTAGIILNVIFHQPVIAVDRHVFRVSNRTGLAKGRDVSSVEQRLIQRVPDEFKSRAHYWLVLHGRYTCLARKPRCVNCVINPFCEYDQKTTG